MSLPGAISDGISTGSITVITTAGTTDANFMKNMLFVTTFDEDEGENNNVIYTSFFGPNVAAGQVYSANVSIYSVLRLVEDAMGLGTLGRNDASAAVIPASASFWR